MKRLPLLQSICVGALGAADEADDVSPPPASAAGTAKAATNSEAEYLHRRPIASSSSGGFLDRPEASPPQDTSTPAAPERSQASSPVPAVATPAPRVCESEECVSLRGRESECGRAS